MGKKTVAACIIMIPGASLHPVSTLTHPLTHSRWCARLDLAAYHMGGTQYLFTPLNRFEYRAASHSGVPGSLFRQPRARDKILKGICLPCYHTESYLSTPIMDVIDVSNFIEDVGAVEPGPHELPDGRRHPVDQSECV